MAECTDPMMRDQLPMLLVARAEADSDRSQVEAHVRNCDACREELRLLEAVRGATVVPAMNAARIASAIPPYQRPAATTTRGRWIVPVTLAASLVIAVSVAWNQRAALRGGDTVLASVDAPVSAGELVIGDNLSDLTEAELRAIVDEVTALQPTLESEPDLMLPALDGTGWAAAGGEL